MMRKSFLNMLTLFLINLLLYKSESAPSHFSNNNFVNIEEVINGKTVLLQCQSNILNYNFECWLFDKINKIVIGPSNPYDKHKYKYEILSGNLTVKAVTKDDEGRYSCISRAVSGGKLNVEHVDIIVVQTSEVNTIRALVALIAMVLLGAGAYTLYSIWKDRYKYPAYLEQSEEDDEDSGEELFSAPGTSGTSTARGNEASFDMISTDFKSILNTSTDT